jgi:predicted ester cyclase
MDDERQLEEFASRYTAAWCSHNPQAVAEFFAPEGSLTINGGTPALGRAAIGNAARAFMTDFPNLRLTFDRFVLQEEKMEFHWTLSGHNTGPGGTGKRVRISGFEQWKMGPDGLIAESQGHFDADEYRRQIKQGVGGA